MELNLVERKCANPKCMQTFKVLESDTKSIYHSMACMYSHQNKTIDWSIYENKLSSLPKEVRRYITITEIPKIH